MTSADTQAGIEHLDCCINVYVVCYTFFGWNLLEFDFATTPVIMLMFGDTRYDECSTRTRRANPTETEEWRGKPP